MDYCFGIPVQTQQTKLTKVIEYWPRTEIISESDVISMVEFSIGTASAKFSSTKRKGQKERRSFTSRFHIPRAFSFLAAHTTCKKYKCRKGTKTLPSLKRISTNNLSVGTRRLSGFRVFFAACFNLDHTFKIESNRRHTYWPIINTYRPMAQPTPLRRSKSRCC